MGPLLTLDRGNSTLDGMWHTEPPTRARVDPDDLAAVERLLAVQATTTVAALTGVASGLTMVEEMIAARGGRVLLAGRELQNPLQVAYADPAGLGVDRWVGAFAGHRLYGAAIVIDCGTAVTVNAVDADGVFRGGAIAPGAGTMAGSLVHATPALPPADLHAEPVLPANHPQGAVDAGVQLGFCGAVDRMVADLIEACGLAGAAVVLTGGTAGLYARHGRIAVRAHPDLLHLGLRWLVESDASNC